MDCHENDWWQIRISRLLVNRSFFDKDKSLSNLRTIPHSHIEENELGVRGRHLLMRLREVADCESTG